MALRPPVAEHGGLRTSRDRTERDGRATKRKWWHSDQVGTHVRDSIVTKNDQPQVIACRRTRTKKFRLKPRTTKRKWWHSDQQVLKWCRSDQQGPNIIACGLVGLECKWRHRPRVKFKWWYSEQGWKVNDGRVTRTKGKWWLVDLLVQRKWWHTYQLGPNRITMTDQLGPDMVSLSWTEIKRDDTGRNKDQMLSDTTWTNNNQDSETQ